MLIDKNFTLVDCMNKVVSVFYCNLGNLGRIVSKLSLNLKTHLVHSMILSHIDYCNALFYSIPECFLHKLIKVLNDGV